MQLLLGLKRQEATPLKRSLSNNINDSMLSGPLTPQQRERERERERESEREREIEKKIQCREKIIHA